MKRRIFIKNERQSEVRHLTFPTPTEQDEARHLRDIAHDVGPVAQLVVGLDGTVVQTNQQLRTLFGLTARDTGRSLQAIELSYRPFELRAPIEHAYLERPPVAVLAGRRTGSGGQVTHLVGVSVIFTDVSRQQRLQEEDEHLELILDATNRRGRPVQVRVTCTPLVGGAAEEARGVILLMEEQDGRG